MRKIIISVVLVLCSAAFSYAAPCYGSRMPEERHFSLGLQNYTVFKRDLKDSYGKLSSLQDFLLLSYGAFGWLSIDLKGGTGNIKQHPVGSSRIDYPTYLGGGYGFRIKAYDKDKIKMVCGFQHISIHPHTVFIGATKHKAVLDDWQVSFLASREFKMITPYLGAKYSRMDYIHWTDGERKREKSDPAKSTGLVFGFDLPIGKNIWLNAEGQLFDVQAMALSLNYGF